MIAICALSIAQADLSRFKTPPQLITQPMSGNIMLPTPPQLGRFELGVLDRVTPNFRCNGWIIILLTTDPTPMTPEHHHTAERMPQQAPPSGNFSVVVPSQNIDKQKFTNASQYHAQITPHELPKRQSFAVEISVSPVRPIMQPTPSSITSVHHLKLKTFPTTGRQASLSPTPQRSVVEKDRVDALVNQFETFLEDIFEAEDAFNPDSEVPAEGSLTFFASESLPEEKPWLSREMHRKLDAHLRRLSKTSAGREGSRLDVAELARITAICERCVKAAEEIDLKDLEDDEDAERHWVITKLAKVENAILAGNVIMLLIAGKGTDQQVREERPV
jgi:hypothetical protein